MSKIERAYKKLFKRKSDIAPQNEKKEEVLWYHNFSTLGLVTPQRPNFYEQNQSCKELMITAYLFMAMEFIRKDYSKKASILELFCADGYFSHIAAKWGASRAKGVDKDEREISFAKKASSLLGNDLVCEFVLGDVYENITENFDIVLCTGGLYHISTPVALLKQIRSKTPKYLIVQTVVSLATEDENYFESPAPGWTWGCRFTSAGLKRMIKEANFEIIQFYENELVGNKRKEDRGSVYALCRPVE